MCKVPPTTPVPVRRPPAPRRNHAWPLAVVASKPVPQKWCWNGVKRKFQSKSPVHFHSRCNFCVISCHFCVILFYFFHFVSFCVISCHFLNTLLIISPWTKWQGTSIILHFSAQFMFSFFNFLVVMEYRSSISARAGRTEWRFWGWWKWSIPVWWIWMTSGPPVPLNACTRPSVWPKNVSAYQSFLTSPVCITINVFSLPLCLTSSRSSFFFLSFFQFYNGDVLHVSFTCFLPFFPCLFM